MMSQQKKINDRNEKLSSLLSRQPYKFIVILFLSFTLTLISIPRTLAQISLFTTPPGPQSTQANPWDLNQAYTCGRFWCSDVYIYDDSRRLQTTVLTPELTLATLKELDQINIEVAKILEQRAKLVQQVFDKITHSIINSQTTSDVSHISDWKFWLPTAFKGLWYPATIKPPHPWTPNIEIGIKNQQTVVFIPDQFDLGIASQSIVTVTDIDARANGTTVEELAKIWRERILISLSNALWGHEFDRQYPKGRWVISGAIIIIGLIFIWLIALIRHAQRQWNNTLKQKLNNLTKVLTVKSQIPRIQNTQNNLSESPENSELLNTEKPQNDSRLNRDFFQTISPFILPQKLFIFIKKIMGKNQWLSTKFSKSKQKIYLERQTVIKQKINVCQLLLRVEFILQLLIFLLTLVIITLIFRQIRPLSVYLLKEIVLLILVGIALTIIDKIGDFVIDYYLNRWATEAQVNNPTSKRYTLRVNTYSITLKQATTFLNVVVGIYLGIWIIGIDPSILAGAGIFAVAIALISRNLLEDMLNGILILCSDRYTIGDVIDAGNGMAGLVENINLFVTSLRNLDGQLIAIPNSKITTVINNTKDWSRVNFTLKIAWNEDAKKAIKIMTLVADQMQSESEWCDKFLEPIEVLGVDEISHEGILIHLLIRTQPGEHWGIGREYRLRVKQALDEAGISLGIPHHKISVTDSSTNKGKLLSDFLLEPDD